MFERYTDRARRVVVLAQEHARMLCHDQITCGHLLVLADLTVTEQAATAALLSATPRGSDAPAGHIPFAAELKKACEDALREALSLAHNYVGTEHLLLGVARRENSGLDILVRLGHSGLDVRAAVIAKLGGYREQNPVTSAGPKSGDEMARVRDAMLTVHLTTCDRCALLARLCEGCRDAIGGCRIRDAIERLPGWEVPGE